MAGVFKKVAWNGICLEVPGDWNIVTLGHDHFLMGKNNDPVLEITWTRKPLPGGLDSQMERFSVSVQKRLGITVRPLELPFIPQTPIPRTPDQTNCLKMTMAGFFWESASSRGRGALLMCSQCRIIAMLRFFSPCKNLSDSLMERIVLSFDDQCDKKRIDWNLFGLDLSIPEEFTLLNHRFRPGSFMITFKARAERLTVYSWGPASFLLPDGGPGAEPDTEPCAEFNAGARDRLKKFAQKRLTLPHTLPLFGQCDQGSFLIWEWPKPPWFLSFFKPYEVFRIVHNRKKNRILGVKFTSTSKSMDGWKIIEGLIH